MTVVRNTHINYHTKEQLHRVKRWDRKTKRSDRSNRWDESVGRLNAKQNADTLDIVAYYRQQGYSSVTVATIMGMSLEIINNYFMFSPLPVEDDLFSVSEFLASK